MVDVAWVHADGLFTSPQETERLASDPAPGITASPHEDNLRYFDVTIEGPSGSPFEGGPYLCCIRVFRRLMIVTSLAFFVLTLIR